MGTKSSEMKDGCFAKAAADEPVFVLRAQDKTASKFVRAWAEQFRQSHIKAGTSGHELAKAISKHTEAMATADAMDQWSTRKNPD